VPVIDPDDPLVRTAVFGKVVEDFLQSEIGAYLLQRAIDDEEGATKDLIANAAKWDVAQIVECQAKIWRATNFRTWLAEAVDAGDQAIKLGQEEDR
jgi:hypothetical protein